MYKPLFASLYFVDVASCQTNTQCVSYELSSLTPQAQFTANVGKEQGTQQSSLSLVTKKEVQVSAEKGRKEGNSPTFGRGGECRSKLTARESIPRTN